MKLLQTTIIGLVFSVVSFAQTMQNNNIVKTDAKIEATMFIKSSFNGNIILNRIPVWDHRLEGTDTITGYTFPDDLPGDNSSNYFNYVINENNNYLEFVDNKIVETTSADCSSTKALYTEFKKDDPDKVSYSRVQYNMFGDASSADPVQRMNKGYVKYKIKNHIVNEFNLDWYLPIEWKDSSDVGFRVGLYVNGTSGTNPYWVAKGQYMLEEGLGDDVWQHNNHTIPVLQDDWFELEVYWFGHSDSSKGRFKVAINGQKIFDITNQTKDPKYPERMFYFMPFKIHGATEHAWIADFEYWNEPPAYSVLANATNTLIYTAGANGSINGITPQTVIDGEDGSTVTAITNNGYHFRELNDGVVTASRLDNNITTNINVTANFVIDGATTYYIDATGGNDNNNGTSEATAWKTIEKAHNMMPSMPTGSDVLFKRGEEFSGHSLYVQIGGTNSDPVVIGAYGSGSKPVLKNDTHIICRKKDLGYIHVQDIFFQSPGFGSAVSFAAENLNNIIIARIDVRDSDQNGIYLSGIDGYTIEDCTIKRCGLSGIVIYGSDEGWTPITNGIIRGNVVVDMSPTNGDGITLHKSDGVEHREIGPNHLLENNIIGNCGENAYDLTSGSNITLRNCEGYGSNEIEVLAAQDDVLIDGCYFHDGNRSGIYIAPSSRVKITNTIIENMNRYSLTVGSSSGSGNPVVDVEIYNTNIYHTSDYTAINVMEGVNGFQFKNNIVMLTQSPKFLRYLSTSPTSSNSDFDYNIWWRTNEETSKFGWNGEDESFFNFFDWQNNYLQGSNSVFVYPKWINVLQSDYRLQKGSAGIDKGINVGILEDYEETVRPQGSGYDIGAFEYRDITPVELTTFNAKQIDNTVILNWQTATEVNNYGFEVERVLSLLSQYTEKWETIGFVKGHGNCNSPKEYSYIDTDISISKWNYRLKQIDIDGAYEYFPNAYGLEVGINSLKEFKLLQNYPNPFNPTTVIGYTLPIESKVKIEITNILGQTIRVLVDHNKNAGYHRANWNAENLPSGVYFINITATGISLNNNFRQVKKAILLR